MTTAIEQTSSVWVLTLEINPTALELLGDARAVADSLNVRVGVLVAGEDAGDANLLIHHGADFVRVVTAAPQVGTATCLREALLLFRHQAPRVVLVSGAACGREWASLLAAAKNWQLVSPALQVQCRPGGLEAIGLDASGKLSRSVLVPADQTLVATLRPGVGQMLPARVGRTGVIEHVSVDPECEPIERLIQIEADPATMDIRDATRLVAGGRGLGGRDGFDVLRRFAGQLKAGVAASRMAVDSGWIERDRQVGQTGKTVAPELYVACGISGASHHIDGMAAAKHIVAINLDPTAPILKLAHLGLVADFRATIEALESTLSRPSCG